MASGPGLSTLVAGSEDSWFELRTPEGSGAPLDVSDSRFHVSLQREVRSHREGPPLGAAQARLPISVVRSEVDIDPLQAHGSLLVRYSSLTAAGHYLITILLDGQHIRRSPFSLTVVAAETTQLRHAASARVEMQAGGHAVMTIHACDKYGNRRSSGGDALEVQLQGAEQAHARLHILDLRNGAYELTATAEGAGTFIGRVLLRSAPSAAGERAAVPFE